MIANSQVVNEAFAGVFLIITWKEPKMFNVKWFDKFRFDFFLVHF